MHDTYEESCFIVFFNLQVMGLIDDLPDGVGIKSVQ